MTCSTEIERVSTRLLISVDSSCYSWQPERTYILLFWFARLYLTAYRVICSHTRCDICLPSMQHIHVYLSLYICMYINIPIVTYCVSLYLCVCMWIDRTTVVLIPLLEQWPKQTWTTSHRFSVPLRVCVLLWLPVLLTR